MTLSALLPTIIGAVYLPPALASETLTCCTLASGRSVCADNLPKACKGRSYVVKDRYGHVLRRIKAESSLQGEKKSRRKNDEQSIAERRRQMQRDMALIETYPSLESLKKTHNEILASMQDNIDSAKESMINAETSRDELKKNEITPISKKVIDEYDAVIKEYKHIISTRQTEHDQIQERFERERRRYLELTGGNGQVDKL